MTLFALPKDAERVVSSFSSAKSALPGMMLKPKALAAQLSTNCRRVWASKELSICFMSKLVFVVDFLVTRRVSEGSASDRSLAHASGYLLNEHELSGVQQCPGDVA